MRNVQRTRLQAVHAPPTASSSSGGAPKQQPLCCLPLDMRLELDDTARFRNAAKWRVEAAASAVGGGAAAPEAMETDAAPFIYAATAAPAQTMPLVFPMPFGRTLSAPEAAVAALDDATGASLKFTVC
jgi:ATP citrate (pro-S)-lyase